MSKHFIFDYLRKVLTYTLIFFGSDEKIIMVLAATNHPWDIDEAFRRRFEKRVFIGLPDDETRLGLLKLCLKGVNIDTDLDLNVVAEKLKGFSGSDITNVSR